MATTSSSAVRPVDPTNRLSCSSTMRQRSLRAYARHLVAAVSGVVLSFHVGGAAALDSSRHITMIVPFAAGDALDGSARLLAEEMGKQLKQNVIVENRAGAAGALAAQAVASADPDGQTLLFGTTAMLTFLPQTKKVSYNPTNDFVPVGKVADIATLVAVREGLPAKSLAEFVELAKSQPGKFTYASSGEGTLLHLRGESLKRNLGIDLLHVPYRGMAPAVVDFVAGRVDVMLEPSIVPNTQAGQGRVLAVMSPTRLKEIPDVPTGAEVGLKSEAGAWFGVFAPRGITPGDSAKITQAIEAATKAEAFQGKLPIGVVGSYLPPDQFSELITKDRQAYGQLVTQLGLKQQP